MLQQIVVELELDPTGAAGVRFWGGMGRNKEAALVAERPCMPRNLLGLCARSSGPSLSAPVTKC